ncbi:MAG: hypothetical protein AB7F59_05555 [Bdellovibrionales bacterium]
MRKCFFVFSLLLVFIFPLTLVQAQEYEAIPESESAVDDEPEEIPQTRTNYEAPGLFYGARWGFGLEADSFRNESFRQSGTSYGLGLTLRKPGRYEFGFGGNYLVGQVRGGEVKEIGNPYGRFALSVWDMGRLETWIHGMATFSRPGSKLAARHDTYRAGMEWKFNPLRYVSSLGVGYRWRLNEEDTSVDIRDIVDLELMVGRKIFRQWTVFGHMLWYRAYGVAKDKMEIARGVDWAGIGPGVKWQHASQFFISSRLTYPLAQSRSSKETEVAVWDSSLPSASDLTWRTDVGVQF